LESASPEAFIKCVKTRPTIQWPNDKAVREAVLERPLASSRVIRYLLQEYDVSLPGDAVEADLQIEHVLPQSWEAAGPWSSDFSKEQHTKLKDTWPNLLPLSQPLNASLQAKGYGEKAPRYLSESMYVTPRFVANGYQEWTPSTIRLRGEDLAEWALQRWPHAGEEPSEHE
jgi:hypothetical protein